LHPQATTIPQQNVIRIEWDTGSEANLAGYKVYRGVCVEEKIYERIAIISYGENHYDDADVTVGVKYHYRISAFNQGGSESNLSDMVSYTLLEKPVLVSPADQAVIETTKPAFTWLDVSGVSAYTIHVHSRSADGGLWKEIWESEKVYPYQPLRREYNDDSLAIEPLESGRSYRWRVDSSGGRSAGSQSRWWHFTVTNDQ
jgi:hypothetical protein